VTVEFFDSLEAVPAGFGPSAVAIGKFDGVHAGHRRVIGRLRAVAAERALVATAVTFDRHPLALIAPESCPEALLSNAQKVDRLAETGLDATLMVAFDRAFSEQSPEQFVERILVGALTARVVMVGADFRFGVRGSGTVATLTELGARHGFEVQLIEDVLAPLDAGTPGSRRASSTWIRELLAAGDIGEAARVLGHEPTIRSVVVRGAQRGREMGYPTANLSPDIEGFVPRDGVYAAWLTADGVRYGAAVSIGNNPTFEGVPEKQVEAHVLDESLDLYGTTVELSFVEYIRPMTAFDGMASLVVQMTLDEARIREILGYRPKASA
jgi:riboflavin kinase/FMN adenylyltransferase